MTAITARAKPFDPAAVAKSDPKNTFKALHNIAEWANVFFPTLQSVTRTWISAFKQAASPFYVIECAVGITKVYKNITNFGFDLATGICETISNAYKATKFFLDVSIISVPSTFMLRFTIIGNVFLATGSVLKIYQEGSKILNNGESLKKLENRISMFKIIKSVGLLALGILVTYGTLYTFPVIPLLIAATLNIFGSLAQGVLEQTHPWLKK